MTSRGVNLMKIGITGASGNLGTSVVKQLQARAPAAHIVGVSRSREKVSALGVEARFGDFDQPESLVSAYAGLDKLLIIPSDDLTPGRRTAQHTLAVEAAAKAGVGHIVFISVTGASPGRPGGVQECYFRPE